MGNCRPPRKECDADEHLQEWRKKSSSRLDGTTMEEKGCPILKSLTKMKKKMKIITMIMVVDSMALSATYKK